MTFTDTVATVGLLLLEQLLLGSESLDIRLPPRHILPTHSQCPGRQGTGRSHLEAEVFAVRPLSKGQTPSCQALQAGLTRRGLQLPHESPHLLLHGLPARKVS